MTTLIPKFDLKNGGSTPSGAINRDINLKLADCLSVKDFGAAGDGSTDDTAAIQAAINAAEVITNGIVYFPSGTYKTSSSLNINLNVSLISTGGATIKPTVALTSPCINVGVIGSTPRTSTAIIENIILDGTATTSSGALGFYLWSSNVEVRNCQVFGFYSSLVGYQAYTSKVSNCFFTGATNTSVYLQRECHNFAIRDSRILYSSGDGIYVQSSNSVVISGCDIEQNSGNGIRHDSSGGISSRSLIVRDNYFESNGANATTPGTGNDIYLNETLGTDANDAVVCGNYFEPGGSATINVNHNGVGRVKIQDNAGAIVIETAGAFLIDYKVRHVIPLTVLSNTITSSTPVQITGNYDGYTGSDLFIGSLLNDNSYVKYRLSGTLVNNSTTGSATAYTIKFSGQRSLSMLQNNVNITCGPASLAPYLNGSVRGFVTPRFDIVEQSTNQNNNAFFAALTAGGTSYSISQLNLIIEDSI